MSYPNLPAQGGTPRDVARAVNYLLNTPATSSGTSLELDGGDSTASTGGIEVDGGAS